MITMTQDERDEFEERAAIMQYEGGLSRAAAEKEAFERILMKRNLPRPPLKTTPKDTKALMG